MVVRAVFPGSFDPLTVAHLAIADRARIELGLDALDLAISRVALAKEHRRPAPVEDRLAAIRRIRDAGRPWLDGCVTDAQLLVDIAAGYDVLVVGADKWRQLGDPRFYGDSTRARDDALARLPRLVVAPRHGTHLPEDHDAHVLDLPEGMGQVSSTAVRRGRDEWRAAPGT